MLSVLAVTVAVHLRILHSYFRSDDFLHLYELVNRPLFQFLIKPHGGHLFFSWNVVFWLCHELFGVRAAGYFAAIVLNHVVNTWLLFRLVERVSGRPWLAWAAALVWATAPIHGDVLAWYSNHGQVLLATMVLLVLSSLVAAADRDRPVAVGQVVGWLLLLVVASTCYGSGLAFALVFPLLAALLLQAPRAAVMVLATLWVIVPVLFVADHWLWARIGGEGFDVVPSFTPRPSDLGSAASLLLRMLAAGVKVGQADPLFLPWADPEAPVALAAFVALVVAALVAGDRRERRLVVVFLLVALALYGPIAAGRVALARLLVFTGDQAAQARHHYAGPLPLLLASCVALHVLTRGRRVGRVAVAGLVVVLAGGWVWRTRHLDLHETAREETRTTVAAIRDAVAAAPPRADVVLRNRRFQSVGPLAPLVVFPGWAAVFTIFFPENQVDGHRVYFVEPNPAVRAAAAAGVRSATLLIPPPAGAPG